jgi:hypothetical protein
VSFQTEPIPIELKRVTIVLANELDHAGVAGRLNSTRVDLKKRISALETQLYESLASCEARRGDASRAKK